MFWGIPLSLSVVFWGIGMVDCWHSGIMGIKIGNNRIFVFLLTPPFESSSWGKAPEFLYNQQVTRIFPINREGPSDQKHLDSRVALFVKWRPRRPCDGERNYETGLGPREVNSIVERLSPLIELIPFDDSYFDLLIEWSPTSEFLLQWAGPGFTYPLTHDQLSLLLQSASNKPARAYVYSVRSRTDGRIIGHGELGRIDRHNLSAEVMRILVGPPDLRGKGYGGATVRELVRIGFMELGLHRLDLKVFDFNGSAIRCYERAGFRHEGTLREARKQGDEYWNTHIMGLLRHEWEGA